MAVADTAKVAASSRNAVPTPAAAIRSAPSVGPAKYIPTGSISAFSALA
jgi:hypothetical protein